MKYFSMFTGIGGFELGLGKNNECVGYSEIDKYANAVMQYHFPKVKNYGNARTIRTDELPDFDMLVGGFPCQAFSVAGRRGGFNDTRGTLFFEVARVLKDKRPTTFILENVKGLLSHEKGQTFKVILQTLEELGYAVEWMVLNSKLLGVPQNRERVFIIGHLGEKPRPKILSVGQNDTVCDKEESKVCRTLTARYWKGGNGTHIADFRYDEGLRIRKDGNCPTLTAKSGGGLSCQRLIVKPVSIRRLTPLECERLQGFPDNWTKYGVIDGKTVEISDTQRYKMCGNAVTVNVIQYIANLMRLNK
jgi:DNA (cytosine-5)-methyltransferase 1